MEALTPREKRKKKSKVNAPKHDLTKEYIIRYSVDCVLGQTSIRIKPIGIDFDSEETKTVVKKELELLQETGSITVTDMDEAVSEIIKAMKEL